MAYLHRDDHAGVWCVLDVVVRCVCWVVCFSSLVIFLSCLVFVSVVFSLVSVPFLSRVLLFMVRSSFIDAEGWSLQDSLS